MRRRLVNLLTVLSLLLGVAACVLWVRSYACHDVIYGETSTYEFWKVEEFPGVVRLAVGRLGPVPGRFRVHLRFYFVPDGRMRSESRILRARHTAWWGIGSGDDEVAMNDVWGGSYFGYKAWVVVVRFWLIACLAMVLPVVRLGRMLRRRSRRAAGLCPTCGYDLRASAGRCPECGSLDGTPPA